MADGDSTTSDAEGLRLFDTAWMMATQASEKEIDDYLYHLAQRGFDGAWFTVLPMPWSDRESQRYNIVNDGSGSPAYTIEDDHFILTDGYITRLNHILAKSRELGLRHGLVVAWANEYLCLSSPRLDAANARILGEQIAGSLDHAGAVDYWVFGGDQGSSGNGSCLDDIEHASTWAALRDGLQSEGAHQDVAYHSAPIGWIVSLDRAMTHIDEPWLDVFAPQTGHGAGASKVSSDIGDSISSSNGRPVFAGELTYFMFDCFDLSQDCPGTIGSTETIYGEATAAIGAGAAGLLYGDWDRWMWCTPLWPASDRSSPCDGSIYNTFNTAGEDAFFKAIDQ
ncbi:MAG: DUF4038 domain-containing protein [Actinomycetia bacterium]|nr:DUF4038 domain-containing protein [Actinomycetes bacterium]MCP5031056.1 DUF4038 domain-containing protein [Actinomycetes bacterium]